MEWNGMALIDSYQNQMHLHFTVFFLRIKIVSQNIGAIKCEELNAKSKLNL